MKQRRFYQRFRAVNIILRFIYFIFILYYIGEYLHLNTIRTHTKCVHYDTAI